jgi:hypothetical protein
MFYDEEYLNCTGESQRIPFFCLYMLKIFTVWNWNGISYT